MNSKIRWMIIVILFLFIPQLLGGCGFKDIDKRLFVVSMGIDPAKDSSKRYLVSLKFAIPMAKEMSNESWIVSEEADTISEAVRMIKTKVDKEIDFSHAKVLVYHKDILQPKVAPHLYYWFSRRRDIQQLTWLAIGKPSALDVLKVEQKSERLPSNSLFLALGKDGSETPYLFSEYLFDFKKRFIEKGLDPLLPIIEAKSEFFEMNKVGLFNKQSLKLELKAEESKLLNYFLQDVSKSDIKVNEEDKEFVIDTQKVKTKYKIVTENQKQPYIKIDLSIRGKIEESMFEPSNEEVAIYERLAEKAQNKEVEALLVKLQKANVDPIGFGLRYRSRHFEKDDWETWKRIYPTIKFKVSTDVQIDDTGLVE